MSGKNTIIINGKLYDAISGLPVGAPDAQTNTSQVATQVTSKTGQANINHTAAHKTADKAKTIHRRPQKSQTLRRDILKVPSSQQQAQRKTVQAGHHTQSPLISKFAPHPSALSSHASHVHVATKTAPVRPNNAVKPVNHAQHRASNPQPDIRTTPSRVLTANQPALSGRELKEKLIAERLASAPHVQGTKQHSHKRSLFARAPKVSSVIAVSLAVIFLGGYLTYINMPNLSMRVAASRAGVDATMPDYRPDGYRFDGPIAYNSGEVSLKYASNTGSGGYTINQQNSNWDSQAVLDNYVSQKSHDYLTYSEHGLTIYTYDGKAAWVNGGVFYTIDGSAPLSTDQILRIAGSM